jgi:serine/threonine protein kinase
MDDLTGKILKNQFFLRGIIGQGGMADVYEAWDRQRSVRLAVKVMRRDLTQNELLTSEFYKEVELVKRLSHPNIVRFYEQGEEPPDLMYFVMDYVDGKNLRDAIAEHGRPYSPDEVSVIIKPICNALQFAHQEQVFHCDIKPANILLDNRGQVLLSDFGIARLTNETSQSGTPPYMAPEQFLKQPIGAFTDIYSLGVMTFELLGGKLPFRGDTSGSQGTTTHQRIGWEHIYMPLPSLSQLNPHVSPGIEQVVAKALNKEPGDRYPSVIAFLNEFERVRGLAGETLPHVEKTVLKLEFHPLAAPPSIPNLNPPPHPLPPPPNRREACLVGIQGEHCGQSIDVPGDGLTIGRSGQNRLRLSEASVSRSHAVIRKTRNQYVIEDLGSGLGTGLNNMVLRGQRCALHSGDYIRIGYEQVFQFVDNAPKKR